MNNAPIKDKTREYGPREKITCNLPHSPRHHGPANGNFADHVLHDLETALCQRFGGYTATPSIGGWMDDSGEVMHESGTLYTVSYPGGGWEAESKQRSAALALFVEAGERLGEEWIHIERSYFEAEHRRATVSTSDYSNVESSPVLAADARPPHDPPEKHNRETCPRCIANNEPSPVLAITDNERGLAKGLTDYVSNVERIRQLDKPTRDHINDKSRSTPFARR